MTAGLDLPGVAIILQAATLRDTLKRLKKAEYDMANASKPASARQEWMSDLVNAILWAVVVGIPLFTVHMVMLDFEHSLHMPVQFSFGMSLSSIHHRCAFRSACFSQAGANDCDALNSDSYSNTGPDR